jgi:DNA invertase Pin-like site-specific DNA recombinase
MKTAVRTAQTAVLYARVSSKDQEREGFSIPAQQKLLRGYANENGFTILEEFTDIETAKEAGRGQFGRMLKFLQANPSCRAILVEKTDRLYRNPRDWVSIDDMRLDLHFAKENVSFAQTLGHQRSSCTASRC